MMSAADGPLPLSDPDIVDRLGDDLRVTGFDADSVPHGWASARTTRWLVGTAGPRCAPPGTDRRWTS